MAYAEPMRPFTIPARAGLMDRGRGMTIRDTSVTSATPALLSKESVSAGTAMINRYADRSRLVRAVCLFALILISLLGGCSDERTTSTLPSTHPDLWTEKDAADFHGRVVTAGGPEGCRECHGDDLDGGEVKVSCIDCHVEIGACVICHGGRDNSTGAPPNGLRGELDDTTIAVGAHTGHLTSSEIAAAVRCDACHLVPVIASDTGHVGVDSIAEIRWHGISDAGAAEWDRETRTCLNTYCHGDFSGGNSANAPIWTAASQAECGSCHDVGDDPQQLGWKHSFHVGAAGLACGECHAAVIDTTLQITDIDLHVNGVVDTLTRDTTVCNTCHGPGVNSCTACHGGTDNATGAPPEGIEGETATTELAVGAHTTHVEGGAQADAIPCNTCHVTPESTLDDGHFGVDSIAEITWGGIAGGQAVWDRLVATCEQTYCHGNFAGGQGSNAPVWTSNGQAECGSCHDVGSDPAALGWEHEFHVLSAGLSCSECHADVVNAQLTIIDRALHVDGNVDTRTRDEQVCDVCHQQGTAYCTECHGGDDNQTGAPPSGIEGETATTDLAVGAHSAHVEDGALASAIDCNECHTKPNAATDAGHFGLDSVAEITWGTVAGNQSVWNRATATCSNNYCHGNFTGGHSSNAPVWTSSGEEYCGSCHDVGAQASDLRWKHQFHVDVALLKCGDCHAAVVDTLLNIIDPSLHVNGVTDTLTRDELVCNSCHGAGEGNCTGCHGGTDNQTGAPPVGIGGETLTSQVAVGAHTIHLEGGPLSAGFSCTECHLTPLAWDDPEHIGPDFIAEVTFGPLAGPNAVWNRTDTSCTNTYCHGDFNGGSGNPSPPWTESGLDLCGSCHDYGVHPGRLSGKHEKHVADKEIECYQCHATAVDADLNILDKWVHVDGENTISFSSGQGIFVFGRCTNVGCHGAEDW